MKPYAESCDQNKLPILEVLRQEFTGPLRILEIGSGTGQHAVFFGEQLPHLTWQTSDTQENHYGIQLWLDEARLDNVLPPILLNVSHDPWPSDTYDSIFSANTAHIMHWPEVKDMFQGIGKVLKPGGRFCLYGPFNIDGQYTAASNAGFDAWLRQRDPGMGVRDMHDLDRLANENELTRSGQYPMPADNFILVWEKQ